MAYCAQADLERRLTLPILIDLTDDTVPPETVDAAVLDAEIAAAGEIVDGYLRDRYVLPLDPVPGLVREIVADITAYRLWGRRPDTKGEAPKNLDKAHDTALKLLREIQAGKVTLGVTAGQPEAAPHAESVRVNQRRREFGDDTLERF
jgi:phage gp36-like protein